LLWEDAFEGSFKNDVLWLDPAAARVLLHPTFMESDSSLSVGSDAGQYAAHYRGALEARPGTPYMMMSTTQI
jgi:hypothetical protein